MINRTISDIVLDRNAPDPFQVLVQTDQIKQQRAAARQELRVKEHQQRLKSYEMVRESFDPELWKPLAEKVQPQLNDYYNAFSQEVAMTGVDPYELHVSPKWTKLRGEVELNARKSNAIGEVFKEQYEIIDGSDYMKKEDAKAYLSSVIHDSDFDNLTAAQVAESLNTPAFFDRNSAITDIAKDIEDQISKTDSGIWERNGKVLGSKKGESLRFATDANGNISADTIQHFIRANDNIAESIRYQRAIDDYEKQTGRRANVRLVDDQAAVMEIYNSKYRDDDSEEMKNYIYEEVERSLNTLQRRSTKNEIQSFGNVPDAPDTGTTAKQKDIIEKDQGMLIENIFAPMVGYRTDMDQSLLQTLVNPREGIVGARYITNPSHGGVESISLKVTEKSDIIGSLMSAEGVSYTQQDNGNGIQELDIDISTPEKKKAAINALWNAYQQIQPGKYRLPTSEAVRQLREYDQNSNAQIEEKRRGGQQQVDLGF